MSLNGYAWVEGNPVNLTDASGMQTRHPESNCLFSDISRIQSLLLPESRERIQGPCPLSEAPHPPFGCEYGLYPIPYARVRGFAQGNYNPGFAATACPGWQGTQYPTHHCGLDIVSYSDEGLMWNRFRDRGQDKIRIETSTGATHIYNIQTGRNETTDACVSRNEVFSGEVKFQFIGPAIDLNGRKLRGRKVYAMFDGDVLGWVERDATLRVKVAEGENTSLEVQYVHLEACDGADPRRVGSTISKGQHLGCYQRVPIQNADTPHLHIGYVQRKKDGSRLSTEDINSFLCRPEDIYLNPAGSHSKYGFTSFAINVGRQIFPAYLRYGYSSVSISGTDWESALPR